MERKRFLAVVAVWGLCLGLPCRAHAGKLGKLRRLSRETVHVLWRPAAVAAAVPMIVDWAGRHVYGVNLPPLIYSMLGSFTFGTVATVEPRLREILKRSEQKQFLLRVRAAKRDGVIDNAAYFGLMKRKDLADSKVPLKVPFPRGLLNTAGWVTGVILGTKSAAALAETAFSTMQPGVAGLVGAVASVAGVASVAAVFPHKETKERYRAIRIAQSIHTWKNRAAKVEKPITWSELVRGLRDAGLD